MPNDARLGLILGVGLVILVAAVFFRKDAPFVATPAVPQPAAVNSPAPTTGTPIQAKL